ncbi:hypothetical protein ATCC51562_1725 [Campylobacter concisus ATCC 51562]|uniref:Uncharacterized protein n=1 Tax=Campylobacter concisus ATCC 51562 TaxID=1242969 RepID=U2F7S8_9BACT|nr:hypothetical protein ATCC51562_1725 [Campylobacter concisus ATCC 51562]
MLFHKLKSQPKNVSLVLLKFSLYFVAKFKRFLFINFLWL